MAKLATDILAIKEMINSFKNSNLKVEDIFEMMNKAEGMMLDNTNLLEMEDFLEQDDFDDFDFNTPIDKKGKRYLN